MGARALPRDRRPTAPPLVLQHAGGAKGKAVLEARRKREGARDRLHEAHPGRRAGRFRARRGAARRRADRAGCRRGAARRGGQRPARTGGGVCAAGQRLGRRSSTSTLCARTTRAGPRSAGFAVSDLAVVGRRGPALEALRFALSSGCRTSSSPMRSPTGCASVARVGSAGRGNRVPAGDEARHAAVEGQAGPGTRPWLDRGGRAPARWGWWPCSTPT